MFPRGPPQAAARDDLEFIKNIRFYVVAGIVKEKSQSREIAWRMRIHECHCLEVLLSATE